MGRPAIFGKPMTQSQRNRRYLDKLKQLASQSSKPAPSGAGAGPQVDDKRQTDLEQFLQSNQ